MQLADFPFGFSQNEVEVFMREALREAALAGEAGEFPIGAVLVIDGEIVSRGRARQIEKRSQIAHAEMEALLSGGEPLWSRYEQGLIVTTLEPCPMCLDATVMADVPHIIFASHDALIHSVKTIEVNPFVRRHIRTYLGGVLQEESRSIIARYSPELLEYVVNGAPSGTVALDS